MFVSPLAKLAIGAVVIVGGVILWNGYIGGERREADAAGYKRALDEARIVADAQAERNRELQRMAERRYVVQAGVRDRFIVQTVTEVRHATVHLASCPVGADGVRLLNDAAACAREDRPATCGADGPMPSTR